MREILPDIRTWHAFSQPHGYNFNGYFVEAASGNLCIDPVPPDEADLAEIVRRGVSLILITNRNHLRAANLIRDRTGAKTLIHPAHASHARSQEGMLDGDLREKQVAGPLVAVGVPGKSPGEVALFWPERRILFVGDAVIGNPAGSCGLLREKVMDDPAALRNSVRGLLDLDFDTLLLGDGEPILSGAKSQLGKLVDTFGPGHAPRNSKRAVTRVGIAFALLAGMAAPIAAAHVPSLQECLEGGDFIAHAAQARDNGATKTGFLDRLVDDIRLIQAFPAELRWFVVDPGDAEFLYAEATLVFDAPEPPEAQRVQFLSRCLDRQGLGAPNVQ